MINDLEIMLNSVLVNDAKQRNWYSDSFSQLQWLIFFRFWVGLGLGGVPVSFILYMEFMPTKGRGVWLIWLEAFWTLGSCLEAGLAWLVLDSFGWRWLVGLSSIPLGKDLNCTSL